MLSLSLSFFFLVTLLSHLITFRLKLTGLLCVGMDERTGLQCEGGNARCIA